MRGVLLAVLLIGCVDETTEEMREPVTCESLGCESAICNFAGECTCHNQPCVFCERLDAGVCPD